MKARNLFIFLLIFLLLITPTISSDDSCPSGMRKTYVDDLNMVSYGSARKWLAAVCYFQLPGSLYFQRKVLIEPRFEVHLKAAVGAIDIVESSNEQKLYGFTIVISGYKNTISGLEGRSYSGSSSSSSSKTFTDIGYNNFVNALIIEFDFVQDLRDPSSDSFSIRYCSSSCDSSDSNALASQSLSLQKYIAGQKNEWDFRLKYENKNLYLYSGPNNLLHSLSFDLESKLDTNIAYVGFTGFLESNRGEINLMGTFMCEDNYALSKMIGSFYDDPNFYETYDYEPGDTIYFAFHFTNTKDEKVPHTYGYGIWNYSFFATQDCDSKGIYTISKLDNYTLILSIPACTTIGQHSITLNENKKGTGTVSYYNVVAGPMTTITLVGHDGIIETVPIKSDNDVYYLNYGKSNTGDFKMEENLKIILDFKIADKYGNKVTVSNPDTLFTLVQINSNGSPEVVNTNIIKYVLSENGNYYQMNITVNEIGTYQIVKNDYMDKPIKFTIIPGEADASNSYCYLEDQTSVPTVDVGTTLNYICHLRDSNGNEISINTFVQNSNYEFSCSLDKSWPFSDSFSPSISNDDISYKCSYSVSEIGNYAYNGYLRLKTTKEATKIKTKLNQFYVRGHPDSYIIKKILNPSSKEWLDIDTLSNTIITYVADSKGFITAIDFAESDGDILISSYDSYPDIFNISNLKVVFSSTHDENFEFSEIEGKFVSLDGKTYIGIYTKSGISTDNLIKKSSFYYYLKFTYFSVEKSASIQYILNIGSYVTCFHNLDESKTKVNIDDNIDLLTGGDEIKIGNILLNTNDNNLYNYDIGTNNIKTSLNPTNNNLIFRIVALSIEGIYEVFSKSTQDYDGDLEIIINDVVVKKIKVISEPSQACYLDWVNPQYFTYQSTNDKEIYYEYIGEFDNGNILVNFKLKDKYNNTIEKKDYFTKYPDISSEEYGTDTNYFNISFESSDKGYKFRDDIPYENKQRGWVFKMRESTCNYKYYLRYDGKKGGSPLEIINSYYTLLNTEININYNAYVDVIYKDKNNQNLGLQEEKLIDAQSRTKVIATNTEGHKVELSYESTTSNYALRYKANFTISGTYYINVTLDNDYLDPENTNQLIVIDNIYDLESSKFKMIIDTDNIIDMRTDKSVTLDNYLYEPFFQLYFYSKDNVKTDYDKTVNFQLVLSNSNMSQGIDFSVNKDNDQFIQFNVPNDKIEIFHNLQGGEYQLILSENKNIYNFKLNTKDYTNKQFNGLIVNEASLLSSSNSINRNSNLNSEDGNKALTYKMLLLGHVVEDLNIDADYQKTQIIDQNLKYKAGESGYLMIELRTDKDIRCNSSNYEIRVESCDQEDTTFKATSGKAGVLGVFQVTVTTNKANTYPKKQICQLKIYVNDTLVENLNPEMEVSPNEVVETKILEKYYKTNSNVELLDGNADLNYLFEVASFDQYDNLAQTNQDTIGLKVTYKGGAEYKTNSENDVNTGYRNYILSATKAGTYIVSTSKSGSKGIYLKNEASFLINPGAIDITKTVIKEKTTPIQAGNKPSVSIVAYDRYGNILEYTDYINKFTTTFIDANSNEFNSSPNYDSGLKKVFYISDNEATIVGNIKVKVIYDNQENIDASSLIIEVLPGEPYPPNSILSRETNSGTFTEYANGDSFEVNIKESLQLNVTLYDKYKNYVNNLPANAEILEPVLSGNKMNSITFTIVKNTGNFELDFNGVSKYVYIYQHLIKGTYDLTYKVKSSLGENDFHYYIVVSNGDDLHGNGDYVISNCVLKPTNTKFIAGNYEKFTLELRTQEGLLYNDDIDIDKDISIDEIDDTSFKYGISKSGSDYGIYTITIYSEKKGEYNLNIAMTDPSSSSGQKSNVNSAKYEVIPDPIPDKTKTQIINQPEQSISVDKPIEIQFNLYDKFNNKIEKSDNIIQISYFSLLNNGELYSYTSLNFDNRGELNLMPKYPPKIMSINLLYNNGENTVYIFANDIVINIETTINFMKTQIISSNKEKIYAGDQLDMWLYTFDSGYKCLDNGDLHDKFEIEIIGPLYSSKQYTRIFNVRKTKITEEGSSECNNEYKIDNETYVDPVYKYAGNYIIKVKYDKSNLIGQFNQVCYPSGYDIKGFNLIYSFNPDSISILDPPSFTLTGTDRYGNKVSDPLYNDIDIKFTNNYIETEFTINQKTETKKGTLNYQITIKKIGSYQLHILYKGEEIEKVNNFQENLPIFTILTGPCYAENNDHFDLNPLNNAEISVKSYFTFQCYDKYNNKISKGGETFTVKGDFSTFTNQGDSISLDDVKIIDNGDGSYKVEFIPIMKGIYLFNLLLGKERYGQVVRFELSSFKCTGEETILCPNKKVCVKNILECIEPPSDCDISKPFNCTVDGKYTCVKSQTECDCPDGYIKCELMKYCVKEERKDMCPSFKNIKANCMKKSLVYNFDGICRKVESGPNQRVCPIGKILCPDLSCRDSHDQCVETDKKSGLKQRCIGQQLVSNAFECPSSKTCSTEDEVVCPTGECVSNEIYCPSLNKCNGDHQYLCQNNICATEFKACAESISCGENKLLCSDNICRESC